MRLTSHYPKEVRPVHAVVRLRLTSSLTEQTFLWNVGALRRPRKYWCVWHTTLFGMYGYSINFKSRSRRWASAWTNQTIDRSTWG